jgi:2-haloacid dehalogenase
VHEAVLFDLGKVLLDWDPRYFYRQFFPDEPALERFVREVVAPEWILEMDAGKPAAQAIAERVRRFPQHAELIALWPEGWPTMLRGEIAGSVAILAELRGRGVRLCALTNFSTETFPVARARHAFLDWFEDVVVSGEHGVAKPDPRIYRIAIERCALDPAGTVFVDDSEANVAAGRAAGLHALHFTAPERLRAELVALGLL